MKLSEKAKLSLLRSMKKPLPQMHLLLREHGWKPEYRPGTNHWVWRRPRRKNSVILTRKWGRVARWEYITKIRPGRWERYLHPPYRDGVHRGRPLPKPFTVVDELRRRLKELAQQK